MSSGASPGHIGTFALMGGRRMFETFPRRIELKQTGLKEDGDVAHVVYPVLR